MIKRTLKLSGHQTSLALEPEFWEAIDALALSRNITWSKLAAQIDTSRETANLASAMRLAALNYYLEIAPPTANKT